MNGSELRAAIDTLFCGNQRRAAEELDVGYRTMRAYLADPSASSARPIPAGVANDVRALLARFPGGVRHVDPRATIAILQMHMLEAGWTDAEAAAAILGAATANARRELGDGVYDLLDDCRAAENDT